jgi:acylphosphatase
MPYNNTMVRAYEIQIKGQVQGVSFRYMAQKVARSLGINGTVQNMTDNTVVIHAEGEEDKLEQYLAWCHEGPKMARVSSVECHVGSIKNYTTFEIITAHHE